MAAPNHKKKEKTYNLNTPQKKPNHGKRGALIKFLFSPETIEQKENKTRNKISKDVGRPF